MMHGQKTLSYPKDGVYDNIRAFNRGVDEIANSFVCWTPHQLFFWVIKGNEMGWACGTYGAEESYIQGFDGETWEKECNLKTKA